MNTTQQDAVCLSESEMDAFEALLASDSVPDDCMSLEMLDGYLAGVIVAPTPLKPVEWLPSVWSESDVDMRGSGVQKVLSLVLRYHDELVETLGDPEGWAPFFYGSDEEPDGTRLGDEWMTGFELGLSLWAEDWADGLDGHDAATFEGLIEQAMAPWADDEVDAADDDTRIEWLTTTATAVRAMRQLREDCGLPPVPHATAAAGAPSPRSLDA